METDLKKAEDRNLIKYTSTDLTNTHGFPLAVFAWGRQIAILEPGETLTLTTALEEKAKAHEMSLIWLEI